MEGYDATTYGEAFADVYDEWYAAISDVDATVATLLELAGAGPVLELAVGTGRLAVPLARAGAGRRLAVSGIDASAAMLARLAARDPDRLVETVIGDMAADLPHGPFSLVVIAYNSLFNLTEASAQAACFAAVASRLARHGRFVVEAFVPDEPFPDGDAVEVRSMTAERIVLSVTRNTAATQSAAGQFVEFAGGPGENATVRLRPWAIRYATPAQLDAMASTAGFTLEHRWEDFARQPFTPDSARHVSVYRLA
jgi:SAM-dependent methyltransferase